MTEESGPNLGAAADNGVSQSGHRALRRNLNLRRNKFPVPRDSQFRIDPEEKKFNHLSHKQKAQGHLQELQVWQQMP